MALWQKKNCLGRHFQNEIIKKKKKKKKKKKNQQCKCIHVILTKISLKTSFGKVAFQILVTWLYLENENPYLGCHFQTVLFLFVCLFVFWNFFWIIVVLDGYKYGESFVQKFPRKRTYFYLGPSDPLLYTNGNESNITRPNKTERNP